MQSRDTIPSTRSKAQFSLPEMATQVIYMVFQWFLFSLRRLLFFPPFFALSSPFLPSNNITTFQSLAILVDLVDRDVI